MKKKLSIFICSIMALVTIVGSISIFAKDSALDKTTAIEAKIKKEKGKMLLGKITSVSENEITFVKAEMPERKNKEGLDNNPEKPNKDKPKNNKSLKPSPILNEDSLENTEKPAKPPTKPNKEFFQNKEKNTKKTKDLAKNFNAKMHQNFLNSITFSDETITIDISDKTLIDENITSFEEDMLICIIYDENDNIIKITSADKMPMHHGDRRGKHQIKENITLTETTTEN